MLNAVGQENRAKQNDRGARRRDQVAHTAVLRAAGIPHEQPSSQKISPVDVMVNMPRERRLDVMARAALEALDRTTGMKARQRFEEQCHDLTAEIARARAALDRFHERRSAGDLAPTLSDSIQKAEARLAQMESTLTQLLSEFPEAPTFEGRPAD